MKKMESGNSALRMIYFIFAALLAVGIGLTCKTIYQYEAHHRLEQTAVSVPAQVTRISYKRQDVGSDTRKVYVTYTYKGKTYSNRYDPYHSDNGLIKKGDTVHVPIDPENPGRLRPKDPGILLYIIGGVLIPFPGFFLLHFWSSERSVAAAKARWPECYAGGVLNSDRVRKDILYERTWARRFRLFAAMGFLAAAVLAGGLFMLISGRATVFKGFLPAAVLLLLVIVLSERKKDVRIELREMKFVGLESEIDEKGVVTVWCRFADVGKARDYLCVLVSLKGNTWSSLDKEKENQGLHVAVVDGKFRRFYHAGEFRIE